MYRLLVSIPLVVTLALGCGDATTFWVTIEFPDPQARDQATLVEVYAIEPAETAGCDALLSGSAEVGSADYGIEDQVSVSYPSLEGARPLQDIGPGRRLFFARAEDSNGASILHGCSEAQTGRGGENEVKIALDWACQPSNGGVETCDGLDNDCDGLTDDGDPTFLCPIVSRATATGCIDGRCEYACDAGWVNANDDWSDGCECHPTRQGDEWCDGLDNDCDGKVDGPGCINCESDDDCVDPASCLEGTCSDGVCSAEQSADGTPCDDDLYCTVADECNDGICEGGSRDCSAESDDCNQGACDEETDACVAEPIENGTECDDGLYCTVEDACLDGSCTGLARDCSEEDDECLIGVCNEDEDACRGEYKINGAPCDDGQYCTVDDGCQAGVCVGGGPRDCSAGGGSCVDGVCDEEIDQCEGEPVDAGTPCEDELWCTVGDVCDGAGNCAGTERDCSFLDDQCNTGICSEADDECRTQPTNEGEPCEDGQYCTVGESCQEGSCTDPSSMDCSMLDDECHIGVCNEADQECQAQPVSVGTACNDGYDCTRDDACDVNAVCTGIADDDLCGPGSYCVPQCSDLQSGCVVLPTLQVDCPDPAMGGDVTCQVTTLPESPSQAACLACTAHLIEPLLSKVDFEVDGNPGVCGLDGWQLEFDNFCVQSGVYGCPLNMSGPDTECCPDLVCPLQTGALAGRIAMEVNREFCSWGNEQWRLNHHFDLRAFDLARICWSFGMYQATPDEVFQLQVGDGDPEGTIVECYEGPQSTYNRMVTQCTELPQFVHDLANTRIDFWMHSSDDNDAWWLDDIILRAGYDNCTDTTRYVFEEHFDGCPGQLNDGWNGWSVSGDEPRCDVGQCTIGDGIVAEQNDSWQIDHVVDTSELSNEVNLCWLLGDEYATHADILIEFDTGGGAGFEFAWESTESVLYDVGCEEFCVDLAAINPEAAANPALVIRFTVDAIDNNVWFDEISVGGASTCDAMGTLSTSQVTYDIDVYETTITNGTMKNYPVRLECTWSGSDQTVTAHDNFTFQVE